MKNKSKTKEQNLDNYHMTDYNHIYISKNLILYQD